MKYTDCRWGILASDFNSPFVRNYIWTNCPMKYPELFGINPPLLGIISRENHIEYLGNLESWRETHEKLKARALSEPGFVEWLIDETNKIGEDFNKWSEKNILSADLEKLSSKELVDLLKDFCEKQSLLYSFGIALPALDFLGFSFVERNMKEIIERKVGEGDRAKCLEVLTQPLHNSFAQDQEEDLLQLMSEFYGETWRNDVLSKELGELMVAYPDFVNKLKEHTKKHNWVYYVYLGPAYTEENFLGFVRDYLYRKINPIQKLKEVEDKKKEISKLREQYIKGLNPNKFEELILRLAGKMVWAKPRRKDYQSRSYYHLEKLLREIAKRLYVSLSQIQSAPIEVIEKGFETGQIDLKTINSIYKLHVCVPDDGEILVLQNKEAEEFYSNYVDKEELEDAGTVTEVKGAIAHPGIVRGKVKVINKSDDMAKMEYGDVLVSVATTPSIVPAMKKAAAIVTDEGGLTCHAAIVSRELDITCVIGTKIASRIFKDGDLVEVDAEKGVVRVLKQ